SGLLALQASALHPRRPGEPPPPRTRNPPAPRRAGSPAPAQLASPLASRPAFRERSGTGLGEHLDRSPLGLAPTGHPGAVPPPPLAGALSGIVEVEAERSVMRPYPAGGRAREMSGDDHHG